MSNCLKWTTSHKYALNNEKSPPEGGWEDRLKCKKTFRSSD